MAVPDRFPREISDLVVSFDQATLARRPVRREDVLAELEAHGMWRAIEIVSTWPHADGVLSPAYVDGVLLRSHLEMQRLSEEFQQGGRMERLLLPLVDAAASSGIIRPRIVDVGCGLGYVTRWLAARSRLATEAELFGCDYHAALIAEATRLAERERLRCRFAVANAFALEEPAAIFTSTGVIHHFRGESLHHFFTEQMQSGLLGFVHSDIKPSWLAPVGSWLFHKARMQEPLARIDGVLSAVRAHPGPALVAAARASAAGYALFLFDAEPELLPLLKVMQALIGVREDLADEYVERLGPLRSRVRRVTAIQ